MLDLMPLDRSAVQITAMNKWFGSFHVLRDINLSVQKGEKIVICGPSGSGKSTLIRCINRLEEHQTGQIVVDGTELTSDLKNIDKVRSEVGMVFQQFNLYPHLRALSNVTLALRKVRGMSRSQADDVGMAALQRVGLAHKARAYPGELSGGQQQRVAIARALALEPSIMLFDEPTSSLDPELVAEVLQVMRDLRESGVTMLVVSHEMRFARDAADRIVFMEHGTIVEQGTPAELMSGPPDSRARAFMAEALS